MNIWHEYDTSCHMNTWQEVCGKNSQDKFYIVSDAKGYLDREKIDFKKSASEVEYDVISNSSTNLKYFRRIARMILLSSLMMVSSNNSNFQKI